MSDAVEQTPAVEQKDNGEKTSTSDLAQFCTSAIHSRRQVFTALVRRTNVFATEQPCLLVCQHGATAEEYVELVGLISTCKDVV